MKKTISEQADYFIEEMGLEEEFELMEHIYVENFMISGSETDELAVILQRAHESLLALIWETIREEDTESPGREELEKLLYEKIPASLTDEFIYLREEQIHVLLKVMANQPLEEEELFSAHESFVKRGWVFMFTLGDQSVLIVTKEVREAVQNCLEDEQTKMLLAMVIIMRRVAWAGVNLYGVLERRQYYQMYYKYLDKHEDDNAGRLPEGYPDKALKLMMDQGLEELAEREEIFRLEGDYIIHSDLEDKSDYMLLLRTARGKEYYSPTPEEEEIFKNSLIDQQNRYYQKALRLLKQACGAWELAGNLMYEFEYKVVEEDKGWREMLDILLRQEIVFKDKPAAELFFQNLSRWTHEAKRWCNRGYSNKELKLEFKERPIIPDSVIRQNSSNIKGKKIGRNDPCPCGSGKKYKKCCLGKVW